MLLVGCSRFLVVRSPTPELRRPPTRRRVPPSAGESGYQVTTRARRRSRQLPRSGGCRRIAVELRRARLPRTVRPNRRTAARPAANGRGRLRQHLQGHQRPAWSLVHDGHQFVPIVVGDAGASVIRRLALPDLVIATFVLASRAGPQAVVWIASIGRVESRRPVRAPPRSASAAASGSPPDIRWPVSLTEMARCLREISEERWPKTRCLATNPVSWSLSS